MGTPRWVQYKTWSGIAISGDIPFRQPNTDSHMARAVWLTSQLEAPRWGSVQSWDGAAMSGGILHNIAVQPRDMAQGSLFPLIRKIIDAAGHVATVVRLVSALRLVGWEVAVDGKLRTVSGKLVSGREIRNMFTPPNGKVPRRGQQYDQAVYWATLFHEVLSTHATFGAQSDYAIAWLASGNKEDELSVYRAHVDPKLDSFVAVPSSSLPHAIDFAMAVYHSFSVNGPAPARTALRAALPFVKEPEKFARVLIRRLGTSTYGRWHDDPDDKRSRYDGTRLVTWRADGYWLGIAKRLMPRNL